MFGFSALDPVNFCPKMCMILLSMLRRSIPN